MPLPKRDEVKVPIVGYKYSIGTMVSRQFVIDGHCYKGRVVQTGIEKRRQTYKVLYENGDDEVMTEEELVKIVIN